ncbi:GNAT family N-acetyltransferase [Spongiimicrobium salis]|uniref:GNAT family N-acetyltransferase n=1 Tax=Spongiimicrobium salis TaxID=1667022 RepID=UPI00374D0C65
MLTLQGKHIYLRALEPEDLPFLYRLENDTTIWEISGTNTPYSKHVLKMYLDNAHRDIYEVKQLRLGICGINKEVIGLIDLFDFDPMNHRAGIGIIITEDYRGKGIGEEALSLLMDYTFSTLHLRQLYANILEGNKASIQLFKKMGFVEVGVKKDWIYTGETYKNEILFQKIIR